MNELLSPALSLFLYLNIVALLFVWTFAHDYDQIQQRISGVIRFNRIEYISFIFLCSFIHSFHASLLYLYRYFYSVFLFSCLFILFYRLEQPFNRISSVIYWKRIMCRDTLCVVHTKFNSMWMLAAAAVVAAVTIASSSSFFLLLFSFTSSSLRTE